MSEHKPHSILPDIREAFRLRGDEGVEIRMQVLDAVQSLEEQLEAAEQALVDLHESLFIGSERGLTREALGSMATFAKNAALAAANPAKEHL